MLKLIDYRSKAKGLPDLLPYAALIAPGVILNKDGSFLASWESGDRTRVAPRLMNWPSCPHSSTTRFGCSGRLDAACGSIRSSHRAYPAPEKGHFPDPVTQLIDDERRAFFQWKPLFQHQHHFFRHLQAEF